MVKNQRPKKVAVALSLFSTTPSHGELRRSYFFFNFPIRDIFHSTFDSHRLVNFTSLVHSFFSSVPTILPKKEMCWIKKSIERLWAENACLGEKLSRFGVIAHVSPRPLVHGEWKLHNLLINEAELVLWWMKTKLKKKLNIIQTVPTTHFIDSSR